MIRHSAKDCELGFEIFSQGHDTGYVAATVTVVWSGPDGHNILILEVVFVTFVDELMCSGNKREVVDMVELYLR